MPPTPIRVALDWTPNTLHSGLFLAQSQGFYTSHNLNVTLLPPDPSYSSTPAKILASAQADLALCPSESCIAYNSPSSRSPLRLQAIYAILARDASAIVARTSSSVERIGDLGKGKGKRYGSYNARYEDEIVKAMVERDGGDGGKVEIVREEGKLGMFEAVKQGRVDATWVFRPWEGVEAEMEEEEKEEEKAGRGKEGENEMRYFTLEESGIPYGYSPVIARDAGRKDGLGEEVLKGFVEATRKGYEYAMEHPDEAVEVLYGCCEPRREREFLRRSQKMINGFYGDGRNKLGWMDEGKWKEWVGWLEERKLLGSEEVKVEDLFDNRFAA